MIERIGPVRQMQAGLNRLVNVYRLVARGTIDETMVNEILPGKIKVQDAFNKEMAA